MSEDKKMIPLEIGLEDTFEVDDVDNPKILSIYQSDNKTVDGKLLERVIRKYIINNNLFRNIEVIEFYDFEDINFFPESSRCKTRWKPFFPQKFKMFNLNYN